MADLDDLYMEGLDLFADEEYREANGGRISRIGNELEAIIARCKAANKGLQGKARGTRSLSEEQQRELEALGYFGEDGE